MRFPVVQLDGPAKDRGAEPGLNLGIFIDWNHRQVGSDPGAVVLDIVMNTAHVFVMCGPVLSLLYMRL